MKKILYLGLNPPENPDILHYPVIKIVPIPFQKIDISLYSHLIITSQSTIPLFFQHFNQFPKIIAIGKKTAQKLPQPPHYIPKQETSEGIVELLKTLNLQNVLWPHSTLSRPIISNYLTLNKIPHTHFPIYHTVNQKPDPIPNLSNIEEIIFTSPSTINGFVNIWKEIPKEIPLKCLGPITQKALDKYLQLLHN